MASTYIAIENRIKKAINALNTRQNPSQTEIAREFDVPLRRLRSRLADHSPASAVRGLHNRKLKSDQNLALHTCIKRLNELSLPVRLNMFQFTANALVRQNYPQWVYPFSLNSQWVKRWLNRQPDLHKAKRKPVAVARKNAHNFELLKAHFGSE